MNNKRYLIALQRTRSVTALIAGILVFCCTFAAVAWGIRTNPAEEENLLHYFTVNANLLSAIGAAFMIPYAVDGIRKKRFFVPKWIVLFQYCGAVCVAITMVSTLTIIVPTQGIKGVSGMNFWLHLVTPTLTVILFQCVETGISFTRRDTVLVLIPYWFYMAVYFVMVILIGKERGGWSDFYYTQAYIPVWAALLLMLAIGYAVAAVLRKIQNTRAENSRRRISRHWSEDMDPVELKIEAFGLGRYIGQHCDGTEITVPLDILGMLAERYGVSLHELTRAYAKGALDSLQQKGNAPTSTHTNGRKA